jgi:hypothetical protein
MSSQKPDQPPKTPLASSKQELSPDDLEKVVGGLKKNTGLGKTTKTADPCEGGE